MKKTIRLGVNKGKPRLWVEGRNLTEGGFKRGDRISIVRLTDDTLRIAINAEGERRISGKTTDKGDHPILDLNGDYLEPFAGRDCTLTIAAGVITLKVQA